MIRLLIIDDQDLVRTAMSRVLSDVPHLEVVGAEKNGDGLLKGEVSVLPNVVITDLNLPDIGAISTIQKLHSRYPQIKIVVFTSHTNDPIPSFLLENGVTAFISKNSDVITAVHAIETALKGQRYISSDVAQGMASASNPNKTRSLFNAFSQREMQIVLLFAQGLKAKNISKILFISPKTVNTYRYRIFNKLGIRGNFEFARLAIEHGFACSPNQLSHAV